MRRKTWALLWICTLLSLTGSAAIADTETNSLQILEADEAHLLLQLDLITFDSEPVSHEGTRYHRLHVPGWGSWGKQGEPELPVRTILLGMPRIGVPHVSVIEAEFETKHNYHLYPAPELTLESTENGPELEDRFSLDAKAYATDRLYPGSVVQASEIGYLGEQPVFQLHLYPFQYNPQRQELTVYHRLQIQVTYPQDSPSTAAADRPSEAQSPALESILKQSLFNYDALPHAKSALTPVPTRSKVTPLSSGTAIKLEVEQKGLYRVTYQDLQSTAPELVQADPRTLSLTHQGTAVPLFFEGEQDGTFDPEDSLVFYGQALDSEYARHNVYWLQADESSALRIAERDGSPGTELPPDTFRAEQHLEQDRLCWRAMPENETSPWFWDLLSADGTAASVEYAFELHHIAGGDHEGNVRLRLHGATSGNHLTQLYLNDTALIAPSEQTWNGKVEKIFELAVPQHLFQEGINHLRVENSRPAGGATSEVYVDWFEIVYHDTFVAEDDQLVFTALTDGVQTFQVNGFSTEQVVLYDVTDPAAPARIHSSVLEPEDGGYHLRFRDITHAGQTYLAQRSTALPVPSMYVDDPSALRSESNGATYVIVTHPRFFEAAELLAAYRQQQGETVLTVKTTDVYDEFSHGIKDPQAVQSFLRYAYEHWSPRPVYVLLIGDASLDPKNNLGSSLSDLLPTYYTNTPLFGRSPNDSWYAKVHGDDDYPDLIIGRIPARYSSDVTTVLNKVQTYEQSPPPTPWRRRAVLVADDGDQAFQQDMDTIAGTLPDSITPIMMYGYNPSTSVRDQIDAGALLVAYSGHGNTDIWGSWNAVHRIFDQEQSQELANGSKMPFITIANCQNGLFDEYDHSRAMAEEFLLLPGKGGIASWAPATYGFPSSNSLIMEELYRALFAENQAILGSAATTARIQAYVSRPDLPLSLFESFTYFGDPATQLSLPAALALESLAFPDPVPLGEQLTYTLTYTVADATFAPDLNLILDLPEQVAYETASSSPSSIYAQSLTWNLGDTPAGRHVLTVTVQVRDTDLDHGQLLHGQAHLYDATGGDQISYLETAVHDRPIAGLLADSDSPTELESPTTCTAQVTDGTNVVYTWDWGDGTPQNSGATVQHTYASPGLHTAQVTATNGTNSQVQSVTISVVDVPPSAHFVSSSPDRLGQITTLTSTSTGTNLSYRWDFGDGSPPVQSQEPTMTHRYLSLGTYQVILTVTNSVGSSSTTESIQILEAVRAPVASFTSSSPDELGQTTSFINTSQDGGDDEENVSFTWTMGDGRTSTLEQPTHTYDRVGTYSVSLTIRNSAGSDTVYGTVVIADVPIHDLSIVHDGPTSLGLPTTLCATTTSGSNVTYRWAMGDGTSQIGPQFTHTYDHVGEYRVVLTATNSVSSQVFTATVPVVDEQIEGLSIVQDGPTRLGDPTSLAAHIDAGTGVSYLWDLGDGTFSTETSPVHTYPAVDEYTVILTATNSWGTLSIVDTIAIRDVPIEGFNVRHNSPQMLNAPIRLEASLTAGTNVTYNWDLGDGCTATGPDVSYMFAHPGRYLITVTAINSTSFSTRETAVTILDPEKAMFLPLIHRP